MRKDIPLILGLIVLIVISTYVWQSRQPQPIGGDRDTHGCLTAGGYTYDTYVGACVREFDMTDNIKQAAKLAVDEVGRGYALTVASFNSYEEPGAFDITLEKGLDRTPITVHIKNWQVQ